MPISVQQIRRAYLRQLDLWRLHIRPSIITKLRRSAAVQEVVNHFAHGNQELRYPGHFRLELSELFIRENAASPHLVLVPEDLDRIIRGLRHKTCFLGCRFRNPHKTLLERNIRRLVQCYGLDLEADDADSEFRALLPGIISKIEKAPICFFDGRYTRQRPNVFIECGASYALQRLTILTAHRSDLLKPSGGSPTDFQGMIYNPYSTYKDLVEQLSVRLPRALREHYGQAKR